MSYITFKQRDSNWEAFEIEAYIPMQYFSNVLGLMMYVYVY